MLAASATFLLFLGLAVTLATLPADAEPMERIEVAPDHWTFREARSGRPFVPFGTNYTPAWSGWAPDYLSAERFDPAKVEADFARMQELGVNICKIAFSYRRMLPDPQAPANVTPDPGSMDRFDRLLDIAGKHNIRLIVAMEANWHGWPQWLRNGGHYYGEGTRRILASFWRQFVGKHRGDGRIFAYAFCVETELGGWGSPDAQPVWHEWAKTRYGTLEAANHAWGTSYKSWEEIPAAGHDGRNAENWRDQPEGTDANENKTGDAFLYDYLLFREYAAFRHMHNQARAVKAADPKALCTMGFVQWNPIMRMIWAPNWEGPDVGPEYNVREMAKTFDFVGIHFYPIYPNGDDQTQLKYLEVWARWAWAGKPVVLEEFNGPPAEKNPGWCEKVITHSRDYVSGWLVWTFQDTPHSDNVTEVCGLLDGEGKLTPWGERFRDMAPGIKSAPLRRVPGTRLVKANKRQLFTSSRYRELLDGLLKSGTCSVDFETESNPTIDALLKAEKGSR